MKRFILLGALILLFGAAHPAVAAPSLIDHYRQALAADPQNQTLRYHLGVALLNRGQTQEALKAFRVVYPSRLDDPEINFNLALSYARLKDPDSALLFLDQSQANGAESEPDIYPLRNAYFNVVLLYAEQGRLSEAVDLLQRLVTENPDRIEYLRQLGDYQLRLGQFDSAVKTLDLYLQKMPEDREIRDYLYAKLFNRGLEAYQSKDLDKARRAFLLAQKYAGNDPAIPYYLALFDYQQQHLLQVSERLPAVYPRLKAEQQENARSILYNTALSLKRQGEFDAAYRTLQPLCVAEPPRAKDLALLGGVELQRGEFESARQDFLRVLQLDPQHPTAADGVLAAEQGAFNQILDQAGQAFAAEDLAAVRTSLERAAAIYPQDNRLHIYQLRLQRALREDWTALVKEVEGLEGQQKFAEALQALHQGMKAAPGEPRLVQLEKRLVAQLKRRIDELCRRGEAAYDAGDLSRARQSFTELLALNPEQRDAADFLRRIDTERDDQAQRAIGAGEAALERGDLLAARQAFRRALEVNPGETAARSGLDRCEEQLKERVDAALVMARRLRSGGDLVATQLQLQEAYGRWEAPALRQELDGVEKELGQRRASLINLVRTALELQNFNRAKTLLDQAESLGADEEVRKVRRELLKARMVAVENQLELARREVAAGRFDVGLKAYRQALDIDPGNAEALRGIRRGRKELDQMIARYLTEAVAEHQAGQLEEARRTYREVLTLDPNQDEALAALRRIERAEGAGLSSRDVERLYLQGISLYTEGDYRQAIVVWRQVLDLDPTHEKARMNIDKAERKLHQIQERQSG